MPDTKDKYKIPGRHHLLKDLVKLHQSIAGEKKSDVEASTANGATDEAEIVASQSDLFIEHFPMGVLFAKVVRDRYRRPLDFQVQSVNRRYAELLGVERVAVLVSPFFDVLPGGREDWEAVLADVAQKGRVAQGVSQSPQGNRSLRVMLFFPRRDTLAVVLEELVTDDSNVLGTALYRLQQAEQVLESVPMLICRFLPGGKLTFANAAYRKFFEGISEPLSGHCYLQVVAAESREFVRSRVEMICQDTSSVTYASPLELAEGRRWVQWTDSGVFDANGVLIEYQSVGRDITAEMDADRQESRLAGLHRDLLSYQVNRRREYEGNQSASAMDLKALAEENRALKRDVKRLEGLTIQGKLDVCRHCFRINDAEGHWMLPHLYFELHTAAKVGSGSCPYCQRKAALDVEQKLSQS